MTETTTRARRRLPGLQYTDHVGLTVRNLERSRRFYSAALAPLGISELVEMEGVVAFGRERPQLWIMAVGVASLAGVAAWYLHRSARTPEQPER